ncbi:hypothetical protein [Jiella avicenniae]|uniref:Uncharacterized protein n=1 Tax=Jiella avicenniae TaxID=2907202 RepID=A0A9X1T9N2_9HYPH|nr:hypothetical protein [Jiella avicenniae]MCE7026488.1 hypothetical protein [Jiella avicenniae]
MSDYRAIEIDFDVHKAIEAERRSFSERPNDALRRLLGLPKRDVDATEQNAANNGMQGRAWLGDGVTLPHGTKVRMTYNKTDHTGEIVDGMWVVGGRAFDSPSGAASGVGRTKKGTPTRLDGWGYWNAQLPGETGWTPIKNMRPEAIRPAALGHDEFLREIGVAEPTDA